MSPLPSRRSARGGPPRIATPLGEAYSAFLKKTYSIVSTVA